MSEQLNEKISHSRRPPGWSRNPSSLRFRSRVAFLAAIAAVASVFLVPELGDFAPFLAASFISTGILSLIGSSHRWRTTPWLVLLNLGTALGLSLLPSFVLGVVRPAFNADPNYVAYAVSALAAIMSGYIGDEWLASVQTLKRLSEHGRPMRRSFFGLSPSPRQRVRTISLNDVSTRASRSRSRQENV